jgi:hypothetical protein
MLAIVDGETEARYTEPPDTARNSGIVYQLITELIGEEHPIFLLASMASKARAIQEPQTGRHALPQGLPSARAASRNLRSRGDDLRRGYPAR